MRGGDEGRRGEKVEPMYLVSHSYGAIAPH